MTSPGQIWENTFPLFHPVSKAQSDADALPTGVLIRNGVDTAEAVTITNEATGLYKAVVTVPAAYENGDDLELKITATVNGLTNTVVIARTMIALDSGAGAWDATVTIKLDGGDALPDCDVILTSGAGSSSSGIIARGRTATDGTLDLLLDEGTYYVWRQKSGIDFTAQPRTLTVSAAGVVAGNTITDGTASSGTAPASITALTPITDLILVYSENAGYRENASESEATLFIKACRILLLRFPKRSKGGGTETEIDPLVIRDQLNDAIKWRERVATPTAGSLTTRSQHKYFDASNFRD